MAAFTTQPWTWMATGVVALAVSASAFAQNPAPASGAAPTVPVKSTTVKDKEDWRAKVQETLKVCYQCHGEGGVSVIPSRPTIAGQKADYLRRQLRAFKQAGEEIDPSKADPSDIPARLGPVMEHMVTNVGHDLIAPIAAVLSSMACDGGKPRPENARTFALPEAGKACVACHGLNGISIKPQVPNLAGQQRSYLRRQLLLLRETAWGAAPREGEAWRSHPIMEANAARLSIADIDAVARYYSALPCDGKVVTENPKTEK